MSNPESKARAGGDLSPAEELKTAVQVFMSDFKHFTTDIQSRMQTQDDRMTKLDRKTMFAGTSRPALAMAADLDAPHQKAFNTYLRSGDDDALRGLEIEGKAMSTAVAADGGFLVSPQAADMIKNVLLSAASLRSISSVVNVESNSYDVLIDRADMGAGWATETASTAETSTAIIEKINIPLYELSAMPKASQRLLDDSAFDLESWLASRIAEKFIRFEAAAFVNGNGVDKPRGFLNYTIVANTGWTWGNIGYVPSLAAATITNIDPFVDLVYSLGAQYRAGASFVMNSKTTATVRKLKDVDGRFLWSDGFAAGEPARLLGYPVLVSEDMPDIAANASPIAFGNFQQGYTIAERPDLRVLRDPFSAKPNVLFYAVKRVGGAVSDFAAIKVLKIAVS
jgi:HK97 family phage major capsid protein